MKIASSFTKNRQLQTSSAKFLYAKKEEKVTQNTIETFCNYEFVIKLYH